VAGIEGTQTKLGIIPVGSGNGLANFLKIPLQIRGAIEVLNRHQSMLIDTLEVQGKTVVSIAGVGYDALVAEKMKKAKVRGIPAYMHFMVREYFWYSPKHYTLQINGETIKTQALFIAFANSNQFGYKRPIIPTAKIDDGLMDICVVQKPPMYLISWVGFSLFFHLVQIHTKYIQTYRTSSIQVQQRKSRIMNIDGEAVKMPRKFEIKVNPKSVEVLIP
ncbi:MAG: diacylglycerol kinase family protein, partial [Bacteroidales bacterium]